MDLESFFIQDIPPVAVRGSYNYWLVGLSFIIAYAASLIAIGIAKQRSVNLSVLPRMSSHLVGGFFLGGGIWSMHFTGMLAYHMDMVHTYSFGLTLLSFLIAVIFASAAFAVIAKEKVERSTFVVSAIGIGAAVVLMHYVGMAAMQHDAQLRYLPVPFALSVLIAICASAGALLLMRHYVIDRTATYGGLSALLMAVAVCGMHYTGMYAAVFLPGPDCEFDPAQKHQGLTVLVSVATLLLIIIPGLMLTILRLVDLSSFEKGLMPRWYLLFYVWVVVQVICIGLIFIELPLFYIKLTQLLLILLAVMCTFLSHFIAKRMQEQRNQMVAAQYELEDYKQHLEQLVEEKTAGLKEATEEAVRANRMKSDFLASMSHELRTPMHAIIGFSRQAIGRIGQWSNERQKENLQRIHDSAQRLHALLNDLLDLSKLESGNMHYDFQEVALGDIIEGAINEVSSIAAEKRLKILNECESQQLNITCDRVKIHQVLINLLSNAMKFSPEGKSIFINCQKTKWGVRLGVRDEGAGVADDELNSIFEKFMQGEQTRKAGGGTGLGLAICKEIVVHHNGKIWASNAPQGGAEFVMVLPLKPFNNSVRGEDE